MLNSLSCCSLGGKSSYHEKARTIEPKYDTQDDQPSPRENLTNNVLPLSWECSSLQGATKRSDRYDSVMTSISPFNSLPSLLPPSCLFNYNIPPIPPLLLIRTSSYSTVHLVSLVPPPYNLSLLSLGPWVSYLVTTYLTSLYFYRTHLNRNRNERFTLTFSHTTVPDIGEC